MAFKTPKPAYDAEVVAKIEGYLDQDYLTEIVQEEEHPDDGIQYLYAKGRDKKSYPRPMFEIISNAAFSGTGPSVTPCQCDRFDQSWNCPEHPEVDWDDERKCWKRPPQGLIDSYRRSMELSPDGSLRFAPRPVEPPLTIRDSDHSYEATVLRDNRSMQEAVLNQARAEALGSGWPVRGQVLGRWARIHQDGSIIFEQTPGEMARGIFENTSGLVRTPGEIIADSIRHMDDPNRNRPGYRYAFARDRWEPDIDDALGDFHVGAETYTGIDISNLTTVPDELLWPNRWTTEGAFDPSVLAAALGVSDAALRAPRILEIDCETEQGAGPLAIEVEPNDDTTV